MFVYEKYASANMDTNNPKQTPSQIAQNVYQNLGSRFGVNQTPTHSHNDIDSSRLNPSAINTSATLSAQPGFVLHDKTIENLQSPIVVFPIPVLNSTPSGAAPEGTLVLSASGTVGLHARINGSWVFIGPTH